MSREKGERFMNDLPTLMPYADVVKWAGVEPTETRTENGRLYATWRLADGSEVEHEFINGRLTGTRGRLKPKQTR